MTIKSRMATLLAGIAAAILLVMAVQSDLPWAQGIGHLHVYRQIWLSSASTGVAWSEGNTLAAYSGHGKDISVWDLSGRKLAGMRRVFPGSWYESSIAFLADRNFILTPPALFSQENRRNSLSIWDVKRGVVSQNVDGPPLGADSGSNWAHTFSLSADKNTVAVTARGGLKIFVYSTRTWAELPSPVLGLDVATAIALSPDGALTAVGTTGGRIAIFDTESGDLIRTIDAYPHLGMAVRALAFSPDGNRIATGAGLTINQSQDDDPVRIWQVSDGTLVRSFHANGLQPIRGIAWRPQGDRIALVAKDDRVRLWNLVDNTVVVRNLQPDVMSAAFSPDGAYLAVCNGDDVTIFKVGQNR